MKDRTRPIVQTRKHNRYPLGVPVIFSWLDAEEVRQVGIGLTRDISVRGAFVFTASPPPLQADIKLKGFLPQVRGAVQSLRIYGQGQVVRLEPIPDSKTSEGFAMAGKSFASRRAKAYA